MTPKLYKAGEVCELLQVQPYVLRSWEKEFPGIGVQGKSPDSPRLYRQSDLEHVQRIKQLVFGEGLTVAGARRKLETEAPLVSVVSQAEADSWVRQGGAKGEAPWYADAAATALRFTRNYLGFNEIDRAHRVTTQGDEAWAEVGYLLPGFLLEQLGYVVPQEPR